MKGTIAVQGMAMEKAYVIKKEVDRILRKKNENVKAELEKFESAKVKCEKDLEKLIESQRGELDNQTLEIIDFQILLLHDKDLIKKITDLIEVEGVVSEFAVQKVTDEYKDNLASMDNEYLNERTSDVEDIKKRLIRILLGKEEILVKTNENMIVITKDLTPTELINMDRNFLKGIILEKGGLSSHCVILARSMGIPCIIGAEGILENVDTGMMILLDGCEGNISIDINESDILKFKKYVELQKVETERLEKYRSKPTLTIDGYEMKVYANITSVEEVDLLLEQGGEGVGLLRTEMLYMEQKQPPTEEFQYDQYSAISTRMKDKPLIIRTLDVGGDKEISYLNIPKEENPFLGYRAIRYCLEHEELFMEQIAAILRAGKGRNVQLMLPMISAIEELEDAKKLINKTKYRLDKENINYGNIKVGMMVETPAAAILSDRFSTKVDFFSIGTNDLTQYLFAADRNNEKVSKLNSYYQPALLRTIKMICDNANKHKIEVDICGQAGEIRELIPLWVGMGIDNLSVSIPSITKVRRIINNCKKATCEKLLEKVLLLDTAQEIEKILKEEGYDSK